MVEGASRACAQTGDHEDNGVLVRLLRAGVAVVAALVLIVSGSTLATAADGGTRGHASGTGISAVTSGPATVAAVTVPRGKPSKPSVSVTYPRSGEVTLSWKAPRSNGATITGYVVQRNVGGKWKTIKTLPASTRTYTATRLPNGNSYQFRVQAKNKSGSGPWSATISAKPRAPKGCHPSYGGPCVPIASDVDCAGGSGDGPKYVRGPVYVLKDDPYRLDADGDRVACER